MSKIFFQDKPGNQPMVAAFAKFKDVRGVMRELAGALKDLGIELRVDTDQRIVTASGQKYYIA